MSNLRAVRLAAVKAKVSMFDVLRALNVSLQGDVPQQIRCPMHDDASPSARVYADGRVHCFVCAQSWDVVDIIQHKLRVPFESALDWMEQRFKIAPNSAGIDLAVRVQLKQALIPDISPLCAETEQMLIAARRPLGLLRYSKLLLALDLSRYQFERGQITYDELRQVLHQLWRAAQTDEGGLYAVRGADHGVGGEVGS